MDPGTFSAARISLPDGYEEAAALTERAARSQWRRLQYLYPLSCRRGTAGTEKGRRSTLQARLIKVLRQQLELVPEDVRARILLASNLAYLGTRRGREHPAPANRRRPCGPAIPTLSTTPRAPTASLERRRRRLRRSRRRLPPDTATGIGRPGIPISIACTTTLNSRNWSVSARSPAS